MAQFERYNFKTLLAGAYYNGTNFTMYSDQARTLPIDISGALITMNMRRDFNLPVVFTFSNDGDGDGQIVITNGSLGKFSIIGTNMNIPAGRYVYTITILTYSDENKKYITGEWVIEPSA